MAHETELPGDISPQAKWLISDSLTRLTGLKWINEEIFMSRVRAVFGSSQRKGSIWAHFIAPNILTISLG